jgi:antitoxin VapB
MACGSRDRYLDIYRPFATLFLVAKPLRQTAKLFPSGRSQAVRLPAEFRFEGKEVFIRRDPKTGDVILSQKPDNWNSFILAIKNLKVPQDFLSKKDRDQGQQDRDPFEGWSE